MAIALVFVTALAATAADLPAADKAGDLAVTALAPVRAALAATIVVAMTGALPASKTLRSSVPSSPALSSRMTRSSKFSVAR